MHSIDQPHQVRRNPFNGETFIFNADGDDQAVGRFDIVLDRGGSGGGNALVHVHPHAEERFRVRSGRLRVVVNGQSKSFGPGEVAIVPRGAPHFFANDHDGETVATVEFQPAQQFVRFFLNFATLAEDHPGWFSVEGDPNLLLMALTLHEYQSHLYLARVPVRLQQFLFACLAPIARWRGYRVPVPPQSMSAR
jgi:mannose-6-phosphate isomerase-like protein (cupin superfamily)